MLDCFVQHASWRSKWTSKLGISPMGAFALKILALSRRSPRHTPRRRSRARGRRDIRSRSGDPRRCSGSSQVDPQLGAVGSDDAKLAPAGRAEQSAPRPRGELNQRVCLAERKLNQRNGNT